MKDDSSLGNHWLDVDVVANRTFWERFGGKPSFHGASVLDVGCCRGSLCVDVALSGARKVTGVDINATFIDYARATLQARYPELVDRVHYDVGALSQYPDNTFDLILSKDAFEHILNLPVMLAEMKRCLKPGGRIYTGYGPLYSAPNGAHGFFGTIPWGHLFLPARVLLALANRGRTRKALSLDELNDWNQLSFGAHRDLLCGAGLTVIDFKVNQSRHPLSRLFSLMRRLPGLENYFTHNIYCILEKPNGA